MIEQIELKHHIQRYIIKTLLTSETARFSEMKPSKTETNLYSYHLKILIKNGLVKKLDRCYSLSQKGLTYVDRINAQTGKSRLQPKIIVMILVQDGYGNMIVQKRSKQPYINSWTLPYGKIHIEDESILACAKREALEKLNFTVDSTNKLRHVGDCYLRVRSQDHHSISATLAHIVRFETDAMDVSENIKWIEPLELARMKKAPCIEKIVARSFFGDEFFFEEFEDVYEVL